MCYLIKSQRQRWELSMISLIFQMRKQTAQSHIFSREVESTGLLSQGPLSPQPPDAGRAAGLQPVPGGAGVPAEAEGGGG